MAVPAVLAAHPLYGLIIILFVIGRFQNRIAETNRNFLTVCQILFEPVFSRRFQDRITGTSHIGPTFSRIQEMQDPGLCIDGTCFLLVGISYRIIAIVFIELFVGYFASADVQRGEVIEAIERLERRYVLIPAQIKSLERG